MGTWEVLPFANIPARFAFLSAHLPIAKNSALRIRSPVPLFARNVTLG